MPTTPYRLNEQIGFLLRRANQRHTALFGELMPKQLTPPQFSALVRLYEQGPLSQNLLGREIAVDAATIKGVVDRLVTRGLTGVEPDPTDQRRVIVSLTDEGRDLAQRCIPLAVEVSEATIAPIATADRQQLLEMLARLVDGVDHDDDESSSGRGVR